MKGFHSCKHYSIQSFDGAEEAKENDEATLYIFEPSFTLDATGILILTMWLSCVKSEYK